MNAVLAQIELARTLGISHHYLGYWVEDCQSMAYKSQYRPHELLARHPADDEEPEWIAQEEQPTHDAHRDLPDDASGRGR